MDNIIIENICKSFGDKRVLKDFSAEIKKGSVNCLMAPSGAGKTTLIRIIMGLETADSGKISGIDKNEIRAVFQEDRLIKSLSAVANIKIATNAEGREVTKLLNSLLLSKIENESVETMSGGEKRRISIARALLSDGNMLILDEPFKGLDEETKDVVIKVVSEYISGKTLLLITHDESEARALNTTNYIVISE